MDIRVEHTVIAWTMDRYINSRQNTVVIIDLSFKSGTKE